MIKIEKLSLSFENKTLFDNTSIVIPNDKFTIITGCNGTGKTTVFKLITGKMKIPEVEIYNDFKKVFFLPQKINYPEGISLYEYVISCFYSNSFKWFISEKEKQKTMEVLELLELSDKQNVLAENLSSGELQKANIAMALLSDADCLLLDEPTSNMDLINQVKVLKILQKLVRTKNVACTVIMHDLNQAANYGDLFVGIGRDKKILQCGKENFFSPQNLNKIFGINFSVVKNNETFNIQVIN